MRLDPSKDLNAQIVAAARRARPPAPTPEPTTPTTSGPAPVDNGAGAASPPRKPTTMTEQILHAAGRLPRW